jgi:hypothetical protein
MKRRSMRALQRVLDLLRERLALRRGERLPRFLQISGERRARLELRLAFRIRLRSRGFGALPSLSRSPIATLKMPFSR